MADRAPEPEFLVVGHLSKPHGNKGELLVWPLTILAYRESVKRGRWQEAQQFCYFDYPINDLSGSTLGIIGAGT
ncbi:MAG TPA: hypothetical protein VK966_05945, partial [Longimicrobiales bacterium]|nr:hypothetical protein [Longimicrobiales bacterium]